MGYYAQTVISMCCVPVNREVVSLCYCDENHEGMCEIVRDNEEHSFD